MQPSKVNVTIRFLCHDIYSADGNSFDFELDQGVTLEQLIETAHGLPHIVLPLDELKKSALLVNGGKGELSQKLADGDNVTVLRPLGGG